MWSIEKLSTKKNLFNFTSSGQGYSVGTTISAGDQIIFNQLEAIIDHGEGEQVYQAIICESCGYTHCEKGNWFALRKAGSFHLFIPAFEWILEEEDQLKDEYFPPKYISTRGAVILGSSTFEVIRELIPSFLEIKKVKDLNGLEAALLYKYENPFKLFGEFPEFGPIRNLNFLMVSEGDINFQFESIIKELKKIEDSSLIGIEEISKEDRILSFFLDDGIFSEWKAAIINEKGELQLIIDDWKFIKIQ